MHSGASFFLVAQALMLVAAVGAGAWAAVKTPPYQNYWKWTWIMSGAFVFALIFLELVPELFTKHPTIHTTSVWVMAGFLFQYALEPLTRGLEHGHSFAKSRPNTQNDHHHHHHHDSAATTPSHRNGYPFILPAICLHAFLEGSLLAPTPATPTPWNALIGISIHKIPVAYVLNLHLRHKKAHLLQIALFALMTPLGALCFQAQIPQYLFMPLYAVATGSLLHIATTILIESAPSHLFKGASWMAILLGVLVAALFAYA